MLLGDCPGTDHNRPSVHNCVAAEPNRPATSAVPIRPRITPPNSPRRNLLLRSEQVVCACFLLIGIAALGSYCLWRGAVRGRLIEIDRAAPLSAQFEVDIN